MFNNCDTYKSLFREYYELKGFLRHADELGFLVGQQDKKIKNSDDKLDYTDFDENDLREEEKYKSYWIKILQITKEQLEKERNSCHISRVIFYGLIFILLIICVLYYKSIYNL